MDAPAVLGIESTAHTASVGVVQRTPDGRTVVLSNLIDPYSPEEGGIHSREAANHHADVLPRLIHEALGSVGVSARELTAVAFSQGPGLGPCLRTGASAARGCLRWATTRRSRAGTTDAATACSMWAPPSSTGR